MMRSTWAGWKFETPAARDQIEQIAMLAGGEVGPLAGGTVAGIHEADHETAPRCVLNVTHAPGGPFAVAVGKVLAAYGFGIIHQAAREVGGGLPHGDLR